MIRRFYVNNFRCLVNFELLISDLPSVLLIGRNGSGKTTVAVALEILQKIARGTNRVGDLAKPKDFTRGHQDSPMRFEIEVELASKIYRYAVAFDLPIGFKELKVVEESLTVGGTPVFSRVAAKVQLAKTYKDLAATFGIDWHLVALPIVQEQSQLDPLFVFKQWLRRMLILRPVPALISGESDSETLEPGVQLKDFGAWFSGILAESPSAYATIDNYLKQVMPDLKDIKNPVTGADSRGLIIHFANEQGSMQVPFGELSDGEKCFMICSLVLAANAAYGPLLCFWDEPDNHLALDEVGHFVLALRRAFRKSGQFIMTSHNPEAIRRFSDENTILLARRSHLEPTGLRLVSSLGGHGDLIGALTRGDLDAWQ